jgi:hypothetical protein
LFGDRNRHISSASLADSANIEFFTENLVARLRKLEVDKASIDEVLVDLSAQALYLTWTLLLAWFAYFLLRNLLNSFHSLQQRPSTGMPMLWLVIDKDHWCGWTTTSSSSIHNFVNVVDFF